MRHSGAFLSAVTKWKKPGSGGPTTGATGDGQRRAEAVSGGHPGTGSVRGDDYP